MPRNVIEYRCLLISPSDVREERDALTGAVNHWNAQIGDALGTRLELVRWESHSAPDLSGSPQEKINEQLLDDCDFAIALFWYRLGTPTKEYESGSLEEIDKFRRRGKRILIYFSSKPIPQDTLDMDQLKRLKEVKQKLQSEGLLGSYSDITNLKEQIQLHLTKIVSDLLSRDRADISQIGGIQVVSLPKPDVRVKVKGGFVQPPYGEVQDIIIIEVQNHSSMTVFLGNVSIKLKGERQLLVPRDAMTGEYQRRRELRPGEKFSFNIFPSVIAEQVDPDEVLCAKVSDDIERTYESDPKDIQSLLKSVLKRTNS
jgi:hypothetical protein